MDVYVQMKSLPNHINGFTMPAPDGGYIIVINLNKDEPTRIKAYNHEMHHLGRDDFSLRHVSVDAIELSAHSEEC